MDRDSDERAPREGAILTDPARAISVRASSLFVRCVFLGFLAAMLWAGTAKLDRVTRGEGRVISAERNSLVQHYEGGIITQVLVEEGQRITQGDVLMRIENSFAEAERAASDVALKAEKLKRWRLLAEAAGVDELDVASLGFVAPLEQIEEQVQLFGRRRATQSETLSVLEDQISQKSYELSERRTRLENKRRERALMAERLDSLRDLSREGAVARNELLQNETQYQQIISLIADLEHQVLQTESSMDEMESRRREAEASFRSEAQRALTETNFEIEKLEETIGALTEREMRFDVVAPTTGTINKLFVSTVNGVVKPGQTLAEIVPEDAPIAVEARIAPRDRGKVRPGLKSLVKVSAYDFTRYGGLPGRVVEVSPDALQDETGAIYFRIRIEADSDSLGGDAIVVPGMVAEVDIISGQQTILDYLLRPVREMGAKALRE